jgi:transcriptional regulator with XRE-family HTH domain
MTLQDYLTAKGETPTEFSRRLDVSAMAVGRYLRGERIPAPDLVLKIAELTGWRVLPGDWYDPKIVARLYPARAAKR